MENFLEIEAVADHSGVIMHLDNSDSELHAFPHAFYSDDYQKQLLMLHLATQTFN